MQMKYYLVKLSYPNTLLGFFDLLAFSKKENKRNGRNHENEH